MAGMGPTMRRKQLGAELRRLRRRSDVSTEQTAAALDCARSRVGHLETGRNAIRKPELTVLLDLYEASADERAVLEELRQEASKRGWWSTYRLPSWLSTFVGLEADALTIRAFEGELIPGLLQTEAYARRIHVVAAQSSPPEDVERYVSARLERQKRLYHDPELDYAAIVSEAALHRALGDPENVGLEQIDHLVQLAVRPNIVLRVLPFNLGLHPSMSGSFTVLGFGEHAASVGYQEYAIGGHLVDEPDSVNRLTELWGSLEQRSLPPEQSVQWMSQLAKEAGGNE